MAKRSVAPRRAPDPETRRRHADRSRKALLQAALIEFARHGFAGTRIGDIANRAGVNKQLISYYFGGKQGLYAALVERWLNIEATLTTPDMPVEDVVVAYLDLITQQQELFRLFLWEGLAYQPGGPAPEDPASAPELVDMARRQANGELDTDFDPACLLLISMAITILPVAIPHQVKQFTGLEPMSPEFMDRYREQVRLLIRHLAPRSAAPSSGSHVPPTRDRDDPSRPSRPAR